MRSQNGFINAIEPLGYQVSKMSVEASVGGVCQNLGQVERGHQIQHLSTGQMERKHNNWAKCNHKMISWLQ